MQNYEKTIIGIVDSGIGGVAVLNKVLKKYHTGNFVYLADNKYMPYGNKTKSWLRKRVLYLINYLKENYKVDYIIIACNTASTAIQDVNEHNIFILNFEENETYLATNTTKRNLPKFCVISDNRLVKQIEKHIFDEAYLEDVVKQKVKIHGLARLDRFILGCTHFELVDHLFKKHCPNSEVIDNSYFLINNLKLCNMAEQRNIDVVLTKEDKDLEYRIKQLISD